VPVQRLLQKHQWIRWHNRWLNLKLQTLLLTTRLCSANWTLKTCPWNLDDSGFQDYFVPQKALAEKGQPLFQVTGGECWETVTVLPMFNVVGEFGPLMVIFKGVRVQKQWLIGSPVNYRCAGILNPAAIHAKSFTVVCIKQWVHRATDSSDSICILLTIPAIASDNSQWKTAITCYIHHSWE